MKSKINLMASISILAIVTTLFFHYTAFTEDKADTSPTNTNSPTSEINVKDAESIELKDTPQIEVQVKDAKTNQTSTLFVSSNERLFKELQDMKIALQQLQQTVDYLVNHVIADLEEENQRLKELLRQYNIEPSYYSGSPGTKFVPGSAQVTTSKINPTPEDIDIKKIIEKQEGKSTPQEFYFKVIEEWGRDPEVVKELGSSASTVKGIIAVVPPNTPKEKLEELAKELRSKYDAYDNINIEVFDDEESAKAFADRNARDPKHNVLSISRHKASGRDIITVYGFPLIGGSVLSPPPNDNPPLTEKQ